MHALVKPNPTGNILLPPSRIFTDDGLETSEALDETVMTDDDADRTPLRQQRLEIYDKISKLMCAVRQI